MNLTHKVSLGSVTEVMMYTCAMYLCTLIVLQCIIYNGWRELVILPIMLLPVGEVKGITMTNVDVNKSMMSCVILRQENESINIWNIRYTSQNVRRSERALFHIYYIYISSIWAGVKIIFHMMWKVRLLPIRVVARVLFAVIMDIKCRLTLIEKP